MEADPFQGEIYAWLIHKLYPQVTKVLVEMDFVRHEWQKTYMIEEEDFEVIEKKILTKTRKIEKETKFKPNVGVPCTYCGCWRWCPAMSGDDVKFKMPTSKEEAIEMALHVERFTKLKAESTKILKNWCDKFGAMTAGGRLWYFNVSKAVEVKDVEDFIVQSNEIGVDVFDCLSVSGTELKKRMNEPLVKELVEKTGRQKVTVKFANKKEPKPKKKKKKAKEEPDGGEGKD